MSEAAMGLWGERPMVVIDFETTGQSPQGGGRATEIAMVRVHRGEIQDHFQSLMFTGVAITPFVRQLTGIDEAMLESAPAAAQVMAQALEFAHNCGLVAHNAAFDRSVWAAELQHAGLAGPTLPVPEFACTVRLSRKLYPESPNCKLGTLAQYHQLPAHGRAHRALADALTTAELLLRVQQDLAQQFQTQLQDLPVSHELLARLQAVALPQWPRCVAGYVQSVRRTQAQIDTSQSVLCADRTQSAC
ncbi:PolC-type DNA polymerase III [Roseateles sp. BYS180W]|uniref:PolC-type DNA polymerase III n=1 Tax=Roseateles rivi TaxID=3299028 RepID=A0ABW7FTT4_9BURK